MESVLRYIRQLLWVAIFIVAILIEQYIPTSITRTIVITLYVVGIIEIIYKRFGPFEGIRISSINHTSQLFGTFAMGVVPFGLFVVMFTTPRDRLWLTTFEYYAWLLSLGFFGIIYLLHAILHFPRGYIKKAGTDSIKVSGIRKAINIQDIEVFKFHMQYIRIKLNSDHFLKSERYYFDKEKVEQLVNFLVDKLPTEYIQFSEELKEAITLETA
ncbi:MAG: hypothetical protein NXI20_00440 [bacterium]|nr:hypothetical protein [bacterium]